MSVWSERGLPVVTLGLDHGDYVAEAETARGHDHRVLPGLAAILAQAERSPSDSTANDLQYLLRTSFTEQRGESFVRFLQASANAAIWLDFQAPSGMLPALPWETAFRQVLGIPIFRLPRHEILPLADTSSLSVSIYIDDPELYVMAGQIMDLLLSITSCTDHNEVDVFGDLPLLEDFRFPQKWNSIFKDQNELIIHSLDRGVSWADHIQSVRPAASVDLLIVIAPAIIIDQRPSLLMSFGSNNQRMAVSPEEIAQCATGLGAWSIGVVGTGGNGGRMLTHELAAARPGPVVSAPSPRDVGLMYRRLLTRDSDPIFLREQATGEASAYVHPDGPIALAPGIEPTARDSDRQRKLREVLDNATLGMATAAEAIPRWLASNQRVLEQFAEPLLQPRHFDDLANERRSGYASGMARVSAVLRSAYGADRRDG